MRAEDLTVQLRARSPWEAVELGMALVRRHAGMIWKPWVLATLPLFALFNAAAWAIDQIWLAGLLMWWLKPVFDRIPLYVISRAVFGATPDVRQTLAVQLRWGWKPMLHHLSWRRLSPVRALYLPVDLLEGVAGERLRDRRRSLGGAVYGNAALLTLVCLHFEAALMLGGIAMILMFAPLDYLPEALRTTWSLIIEQSPAWVRIGLNAFAWLAVSVMEPFYIGAGFGLYLNRRTQLEAWDVEIVFRTLRRRLTAGAASAAMVLALGLGLAARADAQQAEVEAPAAETTGEGGRLPPTLPEVFAGQQADDRSFRKAADRAYQDPAFNRTQIQKTWEKRKPDEPEAQSPDLDLGWLRGLTGVFAFLGEWGLWILVGALVLILVITLPRWLPWMRGSARRRPRIDGAVVDEAIALPEPLPDDVAAVVRRLWREGRPRDALALLYRAGVEAMSARVQVVLPPGATEAECLRLSRRLSDAEDRQLFARIVRVWQYAAYAQRLPDEGEFETLLGQMRQRGGWLA